MPKPRPPAFRDSENARLEMARAERLDRDLTIVASVVGFVGAFALVAAVIVGLIRLG